MRVLVLAGRLARQPWSIGGFVRSVGRGLHERGHSVSLACQSLDDDEDFGFASTVRRFGVFSQTSTDWPLGMAAWGARQRRAIPHDVSISFSRVCTGDVWFPAEPGGAAWLGRAASTRRGHGLALAAARHHGAFRSWARDALLRRPRGVVRRIIAVGPTSAGEAERFLAAAGLDDRVVQAPYFSMLEPPESGRTELRERTRALLNIAPERRVVLVSCMGAQGPSLDNLLTAAADLTSRDRDRGPVVLAMASEGFALHTRAVRLGAQAHLRIIGPTLRSDAAMAAADLCAAAVRPARGLFESGALGRFAADGLRCGRPLLALSGAPGYDLARQIAADSSSPGFVVESITSANWERALRTALQEPWASDAARAASHFGARLGFGGLMACVENALNEAAAERAGGLG